MTIKKIAKKLNKPEKEFNYRGDGRIEWSCEHEVGHTVWSPHKDKYAFTHGCCGCCKDLEVIK